MSDDEDSLTGEKPSQPNVREAMSLLKYPLSVFSPRWETRV
jgi:hypothetical protein